MSRSSNRVGMFTSTRGRKIKLALFLVGGAAVVLFFLNGLLAGPQDSTTSSTDVAGEDKGTSSAPKVEAPVAQLAQSKKQLGEGASNTSGDIFGTDAESDDAESDGDEASAEDQFKASEAYGDAVTLTTKFANAYGTYDSRKSAEDWVASLPSVSDDLKSKLSDQAKGQWEEMKDRKVSSQASVADKSVKPMASHDHGQRVEMAVTVTKKVSIEGKDSTRSQTYVVTLSRADGSWAVSNVR